jgi:L-threonylcarbamoyladenylate synthase
MDVDIQMALEALRKGGVILYPTDTIWGLGCDATNDDAVRKIFRIKQRNDEKSMIILLDHTDKLYEYAEVPEIALNLLQVADKPLTIIYPGARHMSESLIAGDGSIGIRIVQDEFCIRLLRKFGRPIVSTSANISGEAYPTEFQKINNQIISSVDYVVKFKQNDHLQGKPSGIIKLGIHGEVKVIRE